MSNANLNGDRPTCEGQEELGEDPEILKEVAQATQDLADFLKLHDTEVDYCEADWKDTEDLIEGAHGLIIKHPGWQLHYIGGDTFGIDSNYVFFTSKPVDDDVVEKIGYLIVNEGAELPEEVVPPKPKCPKCGKEIDSLGASWRADNISGVASLQDGELYTDVLDGLKVGELIIEDSAIYFCPECDEVLFKAGEEDKVIAFLKCEPQEEE